LTLHDVFAVPYDQIAPIVGRTPVAARKPASNGSLAELRQIIQVAQQVPIDVADEREEPAER
jgi:RNA polymerase sigma-70 factor (ECF subfamily)